MDQHFINDNNIGCHIYVDDVVNGKEILIEPELGQVDKFKDQNEVQFFLIVNRRN